MSFFSFLKRLPCPLREEYCSVGDGHEIHYAVFGNLKGKTVIQFHGGPGSGFSFRQAKAFNLKKYRVLLFDQRGCKLSKSKDIYRSNTPFAAVEDAVKILKHLKWPIKNLIVAGSSYGAALALLFAEKYPKAVSALLLSSVFLARKEDLAWMEKSSLFYPDLMREMRAKIRKNESLAEGYFRLVSSDSYQAISTALSYYGQYEWNLGLKTPMFRPVKAVYEEKVRALRIFLYYETNRMFLKENEILNNLYKIKHIPILVVHNRLDMTCPLSGAFELVQQAEKAKLVIVPDIGHASDMLQKTFQKKADQFLKALRLN